MLIDTHSHINMMVKSDFDVCLTPQALADAQTIVSQAAQEGVATIINVGTSFVESKNSLLLAQTYNNVYATLGIHPNDYNSEWKDQLAQFKKLLLQDKGKRIVGIGEIGFDFHYKEYTIGQQRDLFKAQIELALEYNLAIVVHSRDAYDQTLRLLEEYSRDIKNATMHCFSYDYAFAREVIGYGFKLGIGGTLTYPKNNELQSVVTAVELKDLVLETDAPFLPMQFMRGKKNHPKFIKDIAFFLAQLRKESFEEISLVTTQNAQKIFGLDCCQ